MPIQLQHYASTVASYRVLLYTGLSIGAVVAVIANALQKHSNFYSVAVYLSKSNGTVVVMANFVLLLALLAGRLLQQIFFGPLRPMEVERLYDRMWFFVTESLLAFTIFRDEFDIPFALMFGLLLFTKCFHWLLSDRIEWMDQRPYPGPPLLFHIRTQALVILLWMTDFIVFLLTIENMLAHGVGGTVLFASEYAILLASLGNSVAKYTISVIDLRRASVRGGEDAPPWEDKSMLVFYVELATDFFKLVTYLAFFTLVLAFYGLPLNIVRDVYITARSFIMRFRDLLRYRSATRNMDERYPNATEEELSNMSDRTCIICREELVHPPGTEGTDQNGQAQPRQDGPNTTPKKLPCGHIFHFYCLRSWLERQQSCPTCRRSVLEGNRPNHMAGQAVPRVAAGAVPPAPNGQPAQMQPDPQGGNRGRIFGLMMGGAGMQPADRGQFAHGPLPGQAPQPNGNVMIDRQGLPPAYEQPIRYVRPFAGQAERFEGFFMPDGVWHPWPQGPMNVNNAAPNMQHGETPVPTPTIPRPDSRTQQPETSFQDGALMSGPANADTSSTLTSSQTSAREAAAAAALRRLGPSNNNLSSGHSPIMQNQAPVQPLAPNRTTINGLDANSLSSLPPNNGTRPGIFSQATAPAFIPLFDPHVSSPYRVGRPPLLGRSTTSMPHSSRLDAFIWDRREGAPELPPMLTEEQLHMFDQLTREAIDERLRVLENVQATTARCLVDLLRCRSMLPRSNTVQRDPSQDVHTPSESKTSAGESSSMAGQTPSGQGPSVTQIRQPLEAGA